MRVNIGGHASTGARDSIRKWYIERGLYNLDKAHYGLAAHCWRCERWLDFNIAEFVAKHGNRSILDFKPRCRICGERATKQVTPPLKKFDGYPK